MFNKQKITKLQDDLKSQRDKTDRLTTKATATQELLDATIKRMDGLARKVDNQRKQIKRLQDKVNSLKK